jgi:hypothetical protein
MATRTPISPNPVQQEFVHRSVWKAGVMGAFSVLAKVLAVRFTLLIAVGGAIWLTWVVREGQPLQLATVAVYCAAVVIPLVWLASRP